MMINPAKARARHTMRRTLPAARAESARAPLNIGGHI
jgi:hypothetical protein